MIIFVGSTNPVKINAVKNACAQAWPDVEVIGIEVESGVNAQPRTDDETRLGASNRSHAVLLAGKKNLTSSQLETHGNKILGVGLEGGIYEHQKGELWSTVWACVTDETNQNFESNGARFKLPNIISEKLMAGAEMGPVVGELFADPSIKQKQGAIGVVTKGFVDRTEEYSIIVKLALGLWNGQGWEKQIPQA
jgi:inosine/xanthosine triphosphatase